MNNPLINIIVPVYNVEHYIRKCIDSILSQTYRNLRCILVDDGSTDKSGAICDEYTKKDNRILVIHRTNGGLSVARNSGLFALLNDRVPGGYIAFIDGDDYVTHDYIEFLYMLLCSNDADIAQCGHYIVYSKNRVSERSKNHDTIVLNKSQAIESICYNGIYDVTAWNKLYKLKIFEAIRFPEGKIYEDTAISYLIAEKAKKVVINMTPKYYYIQRYDSIANGIIFNDRKYEFINVGDELADYITQSYPNLEKGANVKRVFVRLSTLSQMVNSNYYDKWRIIDIRHVIKQYSLDILINKKVSIRDKVGTVLLMLGFPTYRIIWKLYYKFMRRS